MELFVKLRNALIVFFITIYLRMYQNCSSGTRLENAEFAEPDCHKMMAKAKLEYQMLMEFEHHKSKLSKDLEVDAIYTDLYVIKINDTKRLKNFSEKYGYIFIRKVFEDENYYLFRKSLCKRRCQRQAKKFLSKIEDQSEIQWTARQSLNHRDKRILPNEWFQDSNRKIFFEEIRNLIFRKTHLKQSFTIPNFNDPLFEEQWYLHNWGQTGSRPENDINVLPVWQSGITGRGVAISVLDDGVQGQSPEVANNYDSTFSEEYLFRSTDFHPIPENSHGTRCAAIAAGVANNNICGVGVAYEAKVGGVRILDGPLTDAQEAISLVHALNHVDIYTASWGPDDKGEEVDGPKILTRMAFIKGVTMGRQGKGSIYVWAAGNGGGYYDNCSLDGYASSPFTLTIGALTEDGRSTYYSEPCPAVIASTYVGGHSHIPPSVKTWQEDKKKIKVVVPEGRGKCKETFQGTSAAAPMAAGVIALVLQANPSLTWRDVQHLIIRTSRVPNNKEDGWFINAAGFKFHPKIGSGVLDSHALVTLARQWERIGSLRVWTKPPVRKNWLLLPKTLTSISLLVLKSSMLPSQRIDKLETVIITVNIRHARRGDLDMVLVSPSGTISPILTRRPHDNKMVGFEHWDFVSLHYWSEDSEGLWLLNISNHNERFMGFCDYLTITLHGTIDI